MIVSNLNLVLEEMVLYLMLVKIMNVWLCDIQRHSIKSFLNSLMV